jgi:hypothetical protein
LIGLGLLGGGHSHHCVGGLLELSTERSRTI